MMKCLGYSELVVVGLLGDLVNAVSEIFDVLGSHAGHRNASVLGQVNAEVLAEASALVGVHASKAKHADLVGDVLPVALRLEVLLKSHRR